MNERAAALGGGHGPVPPAGSDRARRLERVNWVVAGVSAVVSAVFAVYYVANSDVETGHTQRSGWAALLIALVVLALAVAAAVVRPFLLRTRRCAVMAMVATLVFVAGTVAVWQLVARDVDTSTMVGTPVMTDADVQRHLQETLGPGRFLSTRQIPTGVFIQGAKFSSPQEVEVSGYVWQRYPDGMLAESRGVTFPEAPDGYDLQEVYSTTRADGTTVQGWHFNLTLRQHFSYSTYPLDKQNIWLRMRGIDTFGDAVLVPDLSSYPPWTYGNIGLDQNIVSAGWSPYYTGFSYSTHERMTTYGITPHTSGRSTPPELYFNIGVARSYAGPLTGKLLQSVFIAAIMFLALFVYTKDDKRHPRFGFSTWTAISFSVSLLLVIVVDQTQIREIAGDTSLTYLEFFAIAQYIVIMGIFGNAIVIGSEAKVPALEWRDNLLPTLLYWPVLTGTFFAFTLMVFATWGT